MRSVKWLGLGLVVVVAAACSDDQGPDDGQLSAEEAAFIAIDTDAMAGEMILGHIMLFGGFGFGADAEVADERTVSRSRPCPAGGSVSIEGSATRTRGDGVIEWTVTTAGTWDACAHERRGVTLTRNGSWEQTAHRKIVDGAFSGPQTSTKRGSFTWTKSTGESGECSFEVTSVRNPETGTRTVTGNVCGREINREITWKRGEG
ncbi:MAG: hypothetical protein L0271_09460 [Gemmatimonadetes bacterium]|nr:hypothetical protein [Gemmatimonadota bacterium]